MLTAAVLFACAAIWPAAADSVVLKNGKTIEGEITADGEEQVTIKTQVGELTFKKADVKEVRRVDRDANKGKDRPDFPGDNLQSKEDRAKAIGLNTRELHEVGEQRVPCPLCKGTGVAIWLECNRCRGSEKPGMTYMKFAKRWEPCERCGGDTKIEGAMCDACARTGKVYLSQLSPREGGTKKAPENTKWCPTCAGTGCDKWEDCNQCKRSKWPGYLYHGEYLSKCDRCEGKGKIAAHTCEPCKGKGYVGLGGDPLKQFVQPLKGDQVKK
jgi:DnaJ-class molecular chaperone